MPAIPSLAPAISKVAQHVYPNVSSNLNLIPFDIDSGAPSTRLGPAASMWSMYVLLADADRISSHNRQIIQSMIDGAPPYQGALMQMTGQGWRFNINFGEGQSTLVFATSAFYDLIDSVETMVRPVLPPGLLSADDEVEAADVIAEELDYLFRHDWLQFESYWQQLSGHFVGHGTGFAYFPHDVDWKWKPGGWDDFLMPRQTEATEESVEVLCGRRAYLVNELYRFIENESVARADGWNVDEVKRALVLACQGKIRYKNWRRFWAQTEMILKNNDVTTGYANSTVVEAVHYWVREYDGSYSFAIGLEDGGNTDYLYKRLNRYEKATNGFVIFTRGTGNTTYHSIRGLGHEIFPFVQAQNRLRSGLLDSTTLAMSVLLQPADGESVEDIDFVTSGPFSYLSPNAQIIEKQIPDVGTQALPVIQDLDKMKATISAPFASAPTLDIPAGQERVTQYQVQAQQELAGSLARSTINNFYRHWATLLQEQFRRIVAIGPHDDDYPEVKDFYLRCEERGVSAQVIKKVRRVNPVRAIGNGSPAMRQAAFKYLEGLKPQMDEDSRRNCNRDEVSSSMGRHAADRYFPKRPRLASDTKLAQLETNQLAEGEQIDVLPGEQDATHLQVHVPRLKQMVDGIQAQYQQAGGNFAPMRQVVQNAMILHQHCEDHAQAIAVDPMQKELFKTVNQFLQQSEGILTSVAQQIMRHEQGAGAQQPQGIGAGPEDQGQEEGAEHEMGESAQTEAGEQGAQNPSSDQLKVMAGQQQMAFKQQDHQQKMQHRQEDHQQKMVFRADSEDQKLSEKVKGQTNRLAPRL